MSKEVSLIAGRSVDCINKLRELLQLATTATDEKIINMIKESNSIQVMLKLRKSRWTKHEVEYANFLIEEFDAGLSQGLKHGQTKRSYLSNCLICSPMRVSKKFPGKTIGKTNFSAASAESDETKPLETVLERYKRRHFALRIKFLRKILLAELKILLDTKVPMPQALEDSLRTSNGRGRETQPSSTETSPPAMMLFHGPVTVQANSKVDATSLTVKPVPCVPNPKVIPLHIERKPCPPPAGPNVFLQHTGIERSSMPQERKPKSILSTVHDRKFGNSQIEHNDIPDLLSGFDQHAIASMHGQKEKYTSKPIPARQVPADGTAFVHPSDHPLFVGPIGESPYITSKSFDDLHQCLATNQIPHLDLSIGQNVQQQELMSNVNCPPVAYGVPIQVSTSNFPSAFTPYTYTNQQSYTQPIQTVSLAPQLRTQIAKQTISIPAQQMNNVAALPPVQISGNGLAPVARTQKSLGSLSTFSHNGTIPFFTETTDIRVTEHNKRNRDESGLAFHSLLSDGTKRFKSSHAVSTASGSSNPSSSDEYFESSKTIHSSFENSSSSSKIQSKQSSNNSDSSEAEWR